MEVAEGVENSLTRTSVDPRKPSWGQLYINTLYSQEKAFSETIFTVALDWVEVMGTINIEENEIDDEVLEMSENVYLQKQSIGTPMFKTKYLIWLHGEKFGVMHLHPRKLTSSLESTSASIKIENHMLYCEDWNGSLHEVMDAINFKMKHVTRLDIAIDGMNHIPSILNLFNKQKESDFPQLRFVGKAKFTCGILNKQKYEYKYFKIGSGTSEKQITVYEKVSEIEKSNKQYIRDFWNKNGLWPEDKEEMYRVELRMKSGYLKSIKGFNLDACTNLQFLFNLFKTGCRNYFEFSFYEGSKNVSRQRKLKFLPHHFIKKLELLERFQKAPTDGISTAKQSIHLKVRLILFGHMEGFHATNALCVVKNFIAMYRLQKWYMDRIHEWIRMYNRLNPTSHNILKELESLKVEEQNVFQL